MKELYETPYYMIVRFDSKVDILNTSISPDDDHDDVKNDIDWD